MLLTRKGPAGKERAAGGTGGKAPESRGKKSSLWRRLGRALKAGLTYDLNDLFRRHKVIGPELIEEIETLLLTADLGVEATERVVSGLGKRLERKALDDAEAVRAALREDMVSILKPVEQPLEIAKGSGRPFVILVVGVNGSGKTTTIGKLAHRLRDEGLNVMLAAGDTFRAAAVEQIKAWGDRAGVPVVAQQTGADAAAVAYDALASARARGIDVLIADTAGRLHTRGSLMEELKKVRRVLAKLDPEAPHETLLVLDAGTGQNALNQAREFQAAVGVSGIALAKLDGTAKGGMAFVIAERLGIPVRYVGVGEGPEDLRDFAAEEFVDALLGG